MIVYKLTNQNMKTYGGFQWEIGKLYKTSGKGDLCSNGFFHAYEHPLLAVLHHPIHANFENPRLFKATTWDGKVRYDSQMKLGSNKMKLLKEIEIPKISLEQRVTYAIFCALEVFKEESFVAWAKKWLSGEDRSKDAAERATYTSERAASYAVERAAYASAYAAYAAEGAAEGVDCAVYAAADCADCASEKKINLVKIAKKAMVCSNK